MRSLERIMLVICLGVAPAYANEAYEELYRQYEIPRELNRQAVPVCYHHGCESVARVQLSDEAWREITRHLNDPAPDAATERARIRLTIAEFERVAGALAGTDRDRAGDLAAFGTLAPQQDCIDESANTTVYLSLLEQAGLLKWHTVMTRAHRGYLFFGGWPHFTARIRDLQAGSEWVVDSWFYDNGEPPEIMELSVWKSGWKPEGFTL